MTRVFLHSTKPATNDTHWQSTYVALSKAFRESKDCLHQVVSDPDSAELIIICESAQNPMLPKEIIRDAVIKKHRDK